MKTELETLKFEALIDLETLLPSTERSNELVNSLGLFFANTNLSCEEQIQLIEIIKDMLVSYDEN